MQKTYTPDQIEQRWYPAWEKAGCFAPSGTGKPYTILLPPPNVTGTLHMGHAFQHTLMDCLIRAHRMKGFDTLWQVGVDHAGIATEMVVTRQIEAEGGRRDDYTRDEFIDRVWKWKHESGSTITSQMRRLGASADWSRERFTMDDDLSKAVTETFVRLHEEGMIYRGPRLVNWDPVLKTAISDLEVVNHDEQGKLWSIRYPRTDGQGDVIVATTRPETLLGDVCVAVHPDDDRYRELVGKTVQLPLTGREIPVVADEYVDPEFGTGCVKITPGHDFNDWEVGERHGFKPINIFRKDGTLKEHDFDDFEFGHRAESFVGGQLADSEKAGTPTSELIPKAYRGLDRFEARKRIVADLTEQGLLVEEKPHAMVVPRGDRSGQIIEPFLTDQWFVKMDELGALGLEAVESGDVEFVPGNWINTYRHWMENLKDWCISRQLWWGHRIPAWYDAEGNVFVGRSEAEVRERHGLGDQVALERDPDVLETWFSSALWAHSTLGWPDAKRMQSEGFDRYLPTSVLVTGFDIIFFWVARMIMMTRHFTGKVPFEQVYITGLIRDRDGQKMSKSKGNVLDPIDLIDGIDLDSLVEKRTASLMQPRMKAAIEEHTREEFPDGIPAFGADALRFTFAALAGHGRDIKFDLSRCEGYRNFINKLWNASRFVLMNLGEAPPAGNQGTDDDDIVSRWIRSRLARTIVEVDRALADYRFDLATAALYEFVWHEFCDWYLELAKPALSEQTDNTEDADPDIATSTRRTLAEVLDAILRLLHPFIPFVTEEIWQQLKSRLATDTDFLARAAWPEAGPPDEAAEADAEWLKEIILAVRSARTELQLAPGKPMPLLIQQASADDRERLARFDTLIRRLARLESIELVADDRDSADCAVQLAGNMRLLIPLAGLVDIAEELARINKQYERELKGLEQAEKKLANRRFVANAPAEVVDKERQRLAEHQRKTEELQAQMARLRQI